MDLGNRLYELRKTKRISQEEAAEKLGVTRQTISKWETNQSQPDFDKILPICELYEITTEELFGKQKESKQTIEKQRNTSEEVDRKKKTAFVISSCVFLYFIAIIWIMLAIPFLKMDPIVGSSVFLLICAFATVWIIYHFMSMPKMEETKEKQKRKEIEKFDGIIALVFTCIYLFVSFITSAWHITWLIWIVYALIIEIIHLLLGMRVEKNEE